MAISVEQAAQDLMRLAGVPPDLADIRTRRDKRGPYICVLMASEFIGRLTVPTTYRGFRVAIKKRPAKPM